MSHAWKTPLPTEPGQYSAGEDAEDDPPRVLGVIETRGLGLPQLAVEGAGLDFAVAVCGGGIGRTAGVAGAKKAPRARRRISRTRRRPRRSP